MARIDDGQLPGVIHELAAPLADALGAEVLDVVVKGQKGRRLVRLVVAGALPADGVTTSPDPGLDVEAIAMLSRRVDDAIEERDLIAGAYTLEVTSPGADRPLREASDFARNVGRDVRVVRVEEVPGARELTGTLVAVARDGVTLEIDGGEVEVPIGDVDHGKVVLPW